MPSIKSPLRLLAIALALGLTFDLLFYNRIPGISVLLMTLLALAALFMLGRLDGVRPVWTNLWLLMPLLFFAAMPALRADPILGFFNICAVLSLLGLVAYYYAGGRLERLGLVGYGLVLLLAAGNVLVRPLFLVPAASADLGAARQRGGAQLMPVLRGILLSLPVLLVFTTLLASADLVFASYVKSLLRFLNLQNLLSHGLVIGAIGWILAGGLIYALSRDREADEALGYEGQVTGMARLFTIGFVEATTLLVLVDLLFLAFGSIQASYLFGGLANITLDGYTYADYARKGFFELVTVSVLTLGLILALQGLTRREQGRQTLAFKLLSSVMIGLTLLLLVSALQRMFLYEQAYGYTQLRLYVHYFMIWLAASLVWFVIALWFRPERFAIGGLVCVIGLLATLNLVNPDLAIAQENLARYQTTGKLDVAYLTDLSLDATPALVSVLDQIGNSSDQNTLRRALGEQFKMLAQSAPRWQGWPSYNLGRWQAYAALSKNAALNP